jgi:hypothetical protein
MRLSAIDIVTRFGILGAGAIVALFVLIWGGFAYADSAATDEQPDGACSTYSLSHLEADFPKSKFVELDKAQFMRLQAKMIEAKVPLPDETVSIDVTAAVNPDDGSLSTDTVVLFGVDAKGCLVGHMQLPAEVFDGIMASDPA